MIELIAIASGSGVSRDGILLTPEAIIYAYSKISLNGTPSALGHDLHNICGWSLPSALLMESSRVFQSIKMQIPENKEDNQILQNRYNQYMNEQINSHEKEKQELEKRLEKFHINGKIKYLYSNTIAIVCKDILNQIEPSFKEKLDKDSLIDYRTLKEIVPGVFELNEDFVIFAHQFFRRRLSLLNNLNTNFFKTYRELLDYKDLNQKIRIDENMVGLNSGVLSTLEFEYWYGPSFNDDLTEIKNGVCTHRSDEPYKKYSGISETHFQWKNDKENHKVLEMEEILDHPSLGIDENTYGLRYVHSMINIETKEIIHLDGAIRAYDMEQYLDRIDVSIDKAGKHSQYTKLWRVDGIMKLSMWEKIILDYYRDNTLVGEYFGIDTKEEYSKTERPEKIKNFFEKNIPYSLASVKDIKIGFQRILLRNMNPDEILIHSISKILIENIEYKYIEADSIHLIKYLKKNLSKVYIIGNPITIAHEDLYINFPLIEFDISKSQDVIKLLKNILSRYNEKDFRRALTINLLINTNKNSFILSLYGDDIRLKSILDVIISLENIDDFNEWVKNLYDYNSKVNSSSSDSDVMIKIYNSDGFFEINRNIIDQDHKVRLEDDGVYIELNLKNDDDIEFFKNGIIQVAPTFYIGEMECSNCSENYINCDCNVLFDDDTYTIPKEIHHLNSFWTDMKA
mgnify:CR=1 FL=1